MTCSNTEIKNRCLLLECSLQKDSIGNNCIRFPRLKTIFESCVDNNDCVSDNIKFTFVSTKAERRITIAKVSFRDDDGQVTRS